MQFRDLKAQYEALKPEIDEGIQSVINSAYDPVYGARPLKRYIQKYIETLAARFILEDMVSEDQIIVIDKCGDGYQATVKQQ